MMHTSEPQWITFESSMHTLTGCGENITENDKKYEPKKIHINMTKEQHEKMYKMFMAKKMANQRRQMAKRHFKQQVGEIRGQYVDSTVIHELKEHKTDNEDNEYEEKYKKIVDQTDYMFDKDMTTRDVIELFMMSKNDSQLDKLDFTNILPQETSNINYYISYFVACLKNGKTELLPFIVKIHENQVMMGVSEKNRKIDKPFVGLSLNLDFSTESRNKEDSNKSSLINTNSIDALLQDLNEFDTDSDSESVFLDPSKDGSENNTPFRNGMALSSIENILPQISKKVLFPGGGSIPNQSTDMIKEEEKESGYYFKEGIHKKIYDKVHKKVNQILCEKIMMKLRNYKMETRQVFMYEDDIFNQICKNLHLYEKEKEEIEGELFPILEDILCNSEETTYSCVDTELIYHFYRLYLEMYGTENIDSIDFIWNCGEEKKLSNSFYLPKMKIMHDEIRLEDFQEESDQPISKHSIDDFCFTLNEMYDFKENFPYKFENSLLYSFDKNVEINTIIPFLSEYKKFNQMKNVFKEKMSVGCVKEGRMESLSSLNKDESILIQNKTGDKICERALDNIHNDEYIKKNELKKSFSSYSEIKTLHNYSDQKIAQNMEMYYDLDHNYARYDQLGEFDYNIDSYYHASLPKHETEEMKILMKDQKSKDLENIKNEIIINVYDRDRHMSILCQMKLPKSLIQMLENHFDVWFGNSFELMKMKSKSEFEKKHHSVNLMTLLYQNFHMKPYMNRESIKDEWKAFEKMYMSSVNSKGKEESSQIRLSIFDYVSILKNHFTIDDDVNHRIRSTELNNMFVEVLTKELEKKECQLDEDYFITNFADVVKELGLKKKRYASGNFYFGIVRKNIETISV